jgi:hypothetical protein
LAIYFVQGGFKTAQIVPLYGKGYFGGSMAVNMAPNKIILALRLFTAQPMISAIKAIFSFSPDRGRWLKCPAMTISSSMTETASAR